MAPRRAVRRGALVATVAAACTTLGSAQRLTPSIAFRGIAVPAGNARYSLQSTQAATVTDVVAGTLTTVPLSFQPIIRTGYSEGGDTFGGMVDINGNKVWKLNDTAFYSVYTPVYAMFPSPTPGACPAPPCALSAALTTQQDISIDPDHASLLSVGGSLYMVVQFEQPAPASMYAYKARGVHPACTHCSVACFSLALI
jgi:hypothetical protein